ncbi:hypothetical protein PsYK624_133640 [Phanerochaete sordida]|uniref:Uncharacterized protein n=1 Tax=Phanerochaete sordida TaxID=48140 RepID=A0A9P3LKE0_9APHY|nr:hypothetical protein PsYK624_133640 [Phanerochaete sordida]
MSSSSSPSLSATSTDSSASATSTNNDNSGGFSPPSSTLYLLTFLATLFVLLFVSCAIVLRSFIIRRRFRRQVEEQIAAGLLPPEAAFNIGRRDIGEKPKLWDVHVDPTEYVASWDSMSPVSAKLISEHDPNNDPHESPRSSFDHRPPGRFTRFLRRRRAPSQTAPETPALDVSDSLDGSEVQIAVLVAMPTAQVPRDSIPEVVVGIAKIPLQKHE